MGNNNKSNKMDCFLCLQCQADGADEHIQVNSSTWNELNIRGIIEKHLWSMDSYEQIAQRICITCWRILNEFNQFYLRIEAAQANLEIPIKSEVNRPETKERPPSSPPVTPISSTQMAKVENYGIYSEENQQENNIPLRLLCQNIDNTKTNDVENPEQQGHKDPLRYKSKLNTTNNVRKIKKVCNSIATKRKKMICTSVNSESQDPNTLLITGTGDKSPLRYFYESNIDTCKHDAFIAKHFKLTCKKCQKTVTKFTELHQHFAEAHNKKQGYAVCCGIQFRKRGTLVSHINIHLNPKYFKCEFCPHVASSITTFKIHRKSHGDLRRSLHEKIYSCNECEKTFKSKGLLHSHKLTHIPEEERNFPCLDCNKTFAREHLLTSHQRVVHLKSYSKLCDICGECVSKVESFKRHMDKHYGVPQRLLSCEICGRVVRSKHCLSVHMKSIHPKDGKHDYLCHLCSKVYPNKIARREHIRRVHQTGSVYKCTICDKKFKRKDYLKDHMATHTGVGLPTCPYCLKTFNSNSSMHQHRKKLHPKEWQEARVQKYSGKLPPNSKSKEDNEYPNLSAQKYAVTSTKSLSKSNVM